MDWLPVLSIVLTVLVIPALGILLKRYDKKADERSEKREKARSEFNTILLDGILNIGDLADANATYNLDPESDNAKSLLAIRQEEYKCFRSEVSKFKTKQTVRAL